MNNPTPHKKFVVRLVSASGWFFSPNGGLIVETDSEWGNVDVRFTARRRVLSAFKKPTILGTLATITGEAPSLRDAVDRFSTIGDNTAAFLALATNASFQGFDLELAFCAEEDQGKRDFRRRVARPIRHLSHLVDARFPGRRWSTCLRIS